VPLSEQGPAMAVTSSASPLATTMSVENLRNHMDQDLARMSRSHMRRG